MSQFAGRQLDSNESVEYFFQRTLGFLDFVNYDGLVESIVNSELGVEHVTDASTLFSRKHRNFRYRDEIRRWELRENIINELTSNKRLKNDDDIKLGEGGALPEKSILSKKQAYIVIGPPASGKSGISEGLADDLGAVIIDSDYAKRKLPEYDKTYYGASLVSAESSAITFGFEEIDNPKNLQPVIEICLKRSNNIVIPRIGDKYASILSFAKFLKDKYNYDVHLILVALSKRKATIRAALRFFETKRYVPLSLIFDMWGNDPWLTYFYLKSKFRDVFKSFGALSTDVPKGESKIAFDIEGNSPVSKFEFKDIEVKW